MRRVLFLCSQNKLRSPTAERTFSGWPGLEVASAGVDTGAIVPLTPERIQWADLIFVMEKAHRNKLMKRFRSHLAGKRVICLDIPDEYERMDPALIELLIAKAGPYLK
jgi:predicted protein tyrosine phosphatase